MRSQVTFAGLLQAVAALTVAFSLLTAVNIAHHGVELFAHFRLQYLLASVLLMIVFALRRQWLIASSLLLVSVFSASFVAPWYLDDVPQSTGQTLKLVHTNVHASNSDYQRLLDFVRSENPDILFLQEVTSQWINGTEELMADYPFTYAVAQPDNFGIAVFSKIELNTVRHVYSPPLAHPTIIATITVDDQPLTLISTHPTVPLGRFLYDARNEQLQSIAALVSQTSGKLILLGDFNASLWDRRLSDFQTETGLHNTRSGFGIAPSWPTFLPFAMIPIDHAFVSGGIGVVETRTGPRIGSDHLPLVISITL